MTDCDTISFRLLKSYGHGFDECNIKLTDENIKITDTTNNSWPDNSHSFIYTILFNEKKIITTDNYGHKIYICDHKSFKHFLIENISDTDKQFIKLLFNIFSCLAIEKSNNIVYTIFERLGKCIKYYVNIKNKYENKLNDQILLNTKLKETNDDLNISLLNIKSDVLITESDLYEQFIITNNLTIENNKIIQINEDLKNKLNDQILLNTKLKETNYDLNISLLNIKSDVLITETDLYEQFIITNNLTIKNNKIIQINEDLKNKLLYIYTIKTIVIMSILGIFIITSYNVTY